MRQLSLSAVLSVDGNPIDPKFAFNLSQVESDIASQALTQVGTTNPDGSQQWTWNKTDNAPLNIPVKLPFGIRETLSETLALAASITVTLSAPAAPIATQGQPLPATS